LKEETRASASAGNKAMIGSITILEPKQAAAYVVSTIVIFSA